MRSSLGSLVTLQRMQLMLPAMRPLTREGSLPSWSESNSCAQWPSKKTLSKFVVYGPPHLEAGHRSPQDMFDASCHCSWNICGVSGRLFLDACYGAQRANFWHLNKKHGVSVILVSETSSHCATTISTKGAHCSRTPGPTLLQITNISNIWFQVACATADDLKLPRAPPRMYKSAESGTSVNFNWLAGFPPYKGITTDQ